MTKMKKKIIAIISVSAIAIMIAISVNLNASHNFKGLSLKNVEALANDETNPYWEAGYYYCRCKKDSKGTKQCFGGNAISLRGNCYKGPYGQTNCRSYDNNCHE